jgi:hypothetical protein
MEVEVHSYKKDGYWYAWCDGILSVRGSDSFASARSKERAEKRAIKKWIKAGDRQESSRIVDIPC